MEKITVNVRRITKAAKCMIELTQKYVCMNVTVRIGSLMSITMNFLIF